jgi:hypothetical protein
MKRTERRSKERNGGEQKAHDTREKEANRRLLKGEKGKRTEAP